MALTRITKGVINPNENFDTHNIHSTGIVTAIGLDVNGNADISGNMSVGGVLTYEDVTSIDSVGIITAQKDIHVGAGLSVVGVGSFGTIKVGTGITFETNGQGTFSGIVTSRGYELSYADSAVTHNYFKAGRIRIWDNGSHCQFHFGTHPSYAQHQRYSSSEVVRTNAWYLQNTAATRYGITWVNNDGPVHLYYSKGYAPDYSIKLSTTPIGVTVGSGVTIETNGQAEIAGITTFYKDVHIKTSTGRLYVGANDRISLIADPSHSYLRVNGGHFQIHNNNFGVRSYDGNGSVMLFYTPLNDGSGSGGPQLWHYHGNGVQIKRLSTTTSGVNIVGTTTTTQLAVTGVSTFSGTLHFPDVGGSISGAGAPVAKFGNSNDLIIGHDGSDSRIRAAGAGQLILSTANGFRLQNSATNHAIIVGVPNGRVDLFYANSKKLETTSTGVDITGTLNVSDVVGITSSLNVTGITSISSQHSPQPFTVIGGSHPTANYNHRNQFVFRTQHGHTDFKFENPYGGNWHGGSVSHTRILWEAYNERGGSVPGGDYGRQGEFASIQPTNTTPGAFNSLDFKGNDRVVGLSTMMRMFASSQQLYVNGDLTTSIDQVGLGITGNIYHLNDWNSGYSAYDTYFGFPANDQFHLFTNGTRRLLFTSNKLILQNLSQGVEIQSDVSMSEYIKHYGDTNTYFGFPANDQFDVWTGGVRRLNINSGGQFQFNHDAVGTAYNFNGPSGDNNWGGYLKLHSNNGSTVQAEIRTSTSGMMFGYGGSERLRINSSGHVVPGADSSYDLGLTGTRFRSAYVDTYYGDGSNLTGVQGVPTGCILLWSGAANAIPSGFVLCNGSNSTPDLRGKFVVGYHDGNGDYDVGDTGGAETVTLTEAQIPSHNHTFSSSHTHGSGSYSTNTTGSHNHTWQRQDVGINNGYRPWPASNNDCKSTTVNTGSNGNHSHTITGTSGSGTASGTTGNAGSGNAHENRPPYYALCYIMKT